MEKAEVESPQDMTQHDDPCDGGKESLKQWSRGKLGEEPPEIRCDEEMKGWERGEKESELLRGMRSR
jgi:hypothetical protein